MTIKNESDARAFVENLLADVNAASTEGPFPEAKTKVTSALRHAARVAEDENGDVFVETPGYGPALIWSGKLRVRLVNSFDREIDPHFRAVFQI
jgi:hypothetical protein